MKQVLHSRAVAALRAELAPALRLGALVLSVGTVCAEEVAPSIAPDALSKRIEAGDRVVVLDVRTPAEYRAGHIPEAVNIPHTEVGARLGEVPADAEVALYCMVGPRARLAEENLRQAGRGQLLHVEGGLAAWQAAGLPVEAEKEGSAPSP